MTLPERVGFSYRMKTNGRDVSRLRVEYEGGMADTDALVMVEERTVGMLSPVDGRGMKTAYFRFAGRDGREGRF